MTVPTEDPRAAAGVVRLTWPGDPDVQTSAPAPAAEPTPAPDKE